MAAKNPNSPTNDTTISRREREKLAHRQEILDAATRVFAEKGFFSATLDEVAQEAEFSKGTVYLYFSSKDDLLYNVISSKTLHLTQIFHDILDMKSSFKEELRELLRKLAEMAFAEKDFFSIFLNQHAEFFKSLSPDKAEEIYAMHADLDKVMVNRIEKAIEEGELRNITPYATNGIIHGASENMMFTRWDCDTLDELQSKVDVFIDIIFNGIALKKEVGSEQ